MLQTQLLTTTIAKFLCKFNRIETLGLQQTVREKKSFIEEELQSVYHEEEKEEKRSGNSQLCQNFAKLTF